MAEAVLIIFTRNTSEKARIGAVALKGANTVKLF